LKNLFKTIIEILTNNVEIKDNNNLYISYYMGVRSLNNKIIENVDKTPVMITHKSYYEDYRHLYNTIYINGVNDNNNNVMLKNFKKYYYDCYLYLSEIIRNNIDFFSPELKNIITQCKFYHTTNYLNLLTTNLTNESIDKYINNLNCMKNRIEYNYDISNNKIDVINTEKIINDYFVKYNITLTFTDENIILQNNKDKSKLLYDKIIQIINSFKELKSNKKKNIQIIKQLLPKIIENKKKNIQIIKQELPKIIENYKDLDLILFYNDTFITNQHTPLIKCVSTYKQYLENKKINNLLKKVPPPVPERKSTTQFKNSIPICPFGQHTVKCKKNNIVVCVDNNTSLDIYGHRPCEYGFTDDESQVGGKRIFKNRNEKYFI
jgi:hypothetical protein